MAVLNIVKDGEPGLRKVCRPVEQITPRICQLIDDMRDTLKHANGVGLAAPQVGVLRRIVLVQNEEGKIYELINPVIIKVSDEHQNELEGCLSVPGKWGITDRPMTVTVKALDRNGKEFEATESGLTARCFCHELDHLDGVLFYDNAVRILTDEELDELSDEEDD